MLLLFLSFVEANLKLGSAAAEHEIEMSLRSSVMAIICDRVQVELLWLSLLLLFVWLIQKFESNS